jgi:hypothetical protein
MKNPFTRRIQIQWMLATAFAVVSIAGCTSISGTLTWNRGDIPVPSPIIGARGVANPTLQDEIKLQAHLTTITDFPLVGQITYGRVSISGREVSVPYLIDLQTLSSFPAFISIYARPKPGGGFLRGPYNPNNDVAYIPGGLDGINAVTLTSAGPITGFDLNYYHAFRSVGTGQKPLRKFQSQKRHI